MLELPPDGAPWPAAIAQLDALLARTFEELVEWCDLPAALLDHRPSPRAWTGREVLEHVHLTDHFLFVLADKLAARSARGVERGQVWPARPVRFALLGRLAGRETTWQHPAHMTPTGRVEATTLAADLRGDLARARAFLAAMPAGEGTLHAITMSVVGERLDLYQYLTLVALHGHRHLGQLARNRADLG